MRLSTVWWRSRAAALAIVSCLAIVIGIVIWLKTPPSHQPAWLQPGVGSPGGDAVQTLQTAAQTLSDSHPPRAQLGPTPNQRSTLDEATALNAHLDAAAPALAELDAILDQAAAPPGEPDGDPSALGLPNSNRARDLGRTVQFAAIRAAELQDEIAAARFTRLSAAIPRAFHPPTGSVGELVHCTLVEQSTITVERVMALTRLYDADLARLQADFTRLYERNLAEQMLLSERAWQSAALKRQWAASPGLLALGLRGQSLAELPLLHESGTDLIAATRLPVNEQWAALQKVGQQNAMLKAQVAIALRARGQAGLAIAAIACERYRMSEIDWPTSLAAIPKNLLAEVPINPFTGQEIVLERASARSFVLILSGTKPATFVLYSPAARAR